MTAEWYYAKNKQRVGPLTEEQLKELVRSRELSPTDMVWKQGMAKWMQASQVRGLFGDGPPQAVMASIPPPIPEAATEVVAVAGSSTARSPHELKYPVIGMFAVSGLALFLGIIGVLQADSPVVRVLMAVGLAHNIAAVILTVNIVRLRNYGPASLAPWVVMTCWVWYWFTNPAHGMTLLGMVLAVSVGLWAFFIMRGKDVRRAFEADPPLPSLFFAGSKTTPYELDPGTRFPWPVEERTASNPKLLWMKVAIGASVVVGFVFLASIVGALFCLPFFSLAILIYIMGVRKGRLHARWVPVEGQAGWVEFVSGGIFKREDGTVGTFALLPNQKFIDILASGHLVDSWRVLAWGVETLEVQDMAGVVRNFKKGKTLAEKQGSLFHQERTDDLPGSWVPIDGSGKWVQFTKDGAIVFSDGGAGRYTVTGEEPNEIIRATMADGSTREYRVMSLSNAQLVIVEGSEARTYTRHSKTASAASSVSSEESSVTSAEPPAEQESGGGGNVLAGVWNWLRYWKCPKCGMRKAKKTDTSLYEEGQRVQTGWDHETKTTRQMVYSYGIREETYACKACGHTWVERSRYSGPA